jgi:hypothetical protein
MTPERHHEGPGAGPEDDRTKGKRFHNALQLAWRWFQFCVMLRV